MSQVIGVSQIEAIWPRELGAIAQLYRREPGDAGWPPVSIGPTRRSASQRGFGSWPVRLIEGEKSYRIDWHVRRGWVECGVGTDG